MKRRAVVLLALGLFLGRAAFGVTQLIANGGFEAASPAPWQPALGLVNVPVVTNATNANTGNNYLSLGNFGGVASARVFETVTIPTNAIFAPYSFFWAASSSDAANSVQFTPYILDTNGNVLANPGSVFNNNFGYQEASFNLTNFDGRTVEIAFQVDALDPGIGVTSSFRVDDVSLLAYTPDDIPANDYFTNATSIGTASKLTVFGTNVLATAESGESKHAGANASHSLWWTWTAPSNGIVTINTTGSTFNTVLGVYTGSTVSNLTQVAANDDQDSTHGIFTSQVKFPTSAGTEYEIVVDGKGGATGAVQLNLSFVPDTKAPTVKITSPKAKAKLTNSTVTVQGTATDTVGVAFVQYRLENADGTNDYQMADGTNKWSATVTGLIPGSNTIRVQAFDTSSNASAPRSVTFTYVVVSPITVTVNPTGSGTVSPNLGGESLAVGNSFTITAKPAAGWIFSSWTGNIIAGTPSLTFVMQSNMVLQANFVPNPFTPVAGTYQGLFLDTNGPAPQSAGSISLTLATAGSFSAKVLLGGKSYALSGQFSAGGSFSNNIVRKGGLTPLSVQLAVDFQNSIITGLVSDGTFNAELLAGHVASAGAAAGNYTMVIPGSANGMNQPGGDSYGTVKISPTGAISFSGALADGTKITQKANLLIGGNWAFYVPLYSGKGSISGFLHLTNVLNNDITGDLLWAKLPGAGGSFYPGGFTFFSNPLGSAYHFTSGVPVLNPPPTQLWLANGNLANSFTNQIAMDSSSKVTSTNSALKLTVTTSTGLFKGTIANPETGKPMNFNGVVLQNQNFGGGFFVGTNQTGRVFFGP